MALDLSSWRTNFPAQSSELGIAFDARVLISPATTAQSASPDIIGIIATALPSVRPMVYWVFGPASRFTQSSSPPPLRSLRCSWPWTSAVGTASS